ncbi:MAG: protein kinase [Gemmatimonadaceae bacterium]|nr:protein kinase [Gemmatimonadaceae bacterium]
MLDSLRDTLQIALGSAFTLKAELGGGGMSRVFVAREEALSRDVVVKVLAPEMAEGLNVERFTREIRLAAAMQEPHIVPVLTAGVTQLGMPYYTMPLVTGASLRARLDKAPIPTDEAIHILRDVAQALAYAHALEIVHRDIKPENILLSSGTAMVTDFGIAKALRVSQTDVGPPEPTRRITRTGISLGTPAYMAPEQASGDPDTDARADVYAWGLVAYEVLAGRHPFADRTTPQQLIAAQIVDMPASLTGVREGIPSFLGALVMQCLSKEPLDRPVSGAALLSVLDAAGSGTPERRATPLRRNAMLVAAFAGVCAAAIVGFQNRAKPLAPAPIDVRRVVIIPCEDLTNTADLAPLGRVAADYLTQQILSIDSINVIGATTVAAILADTLSAQRDPTKRIAATLRAGTIVTCSIARLGDSLRVDARLVDATTGSIRRVLTPGMGPVSSPMVAIAGVREQLLGAIVSGDLAKRVIVAKQPPKYSAYVVYVEAAERFFRDRNLPEARRLSARAIELDSTFSDAYVLLAMGFANAGMSDDAERIVKQLARRRDELSAYDRLSVDWMAAIFRGDVENAIRATMSQVKRDSSPVMLYNVGMFSNTVLRGSTALPALMAADSSMNAMGWLYQPLELAKAQHLMGEHTSELVSVRSGRKRFPARWEYVAAEVRALACNGRANEALSLVDTVFKSIATTSTSYDISSLIIATNWFFSKGDTVTARELVRMVSGSLGSQSWPQKEPAFLALMALYTDDLDAASRHLRLPRNRSDAYSVFLRGVLAARQGDTTRAQQISHDLGKGQYAEVSQALILATMGKRDEAVSRLKRAAEKGMDQFDWKADFARTSLRGYAQFEALVAPK